MRHRSSAVRHRASNGFRLRRRRFDRLLRKWSPGGLRGYTHAYHISPAHRHSLAAVMVILGHGLDPIIRDIPHIVGGFDLRQRGMALASFTHKASLGQGVVLETLKRRKTMRTLISLQRFIFLGLTGATQPTRYFFRS